MSDVKLKATIEGDSKPLQNALNQAGQAADQAAKTVSGRMDTAAGSMDRAGQSAAQMGSSGKTAAQVIADAMRHPIDTIRRLVNGTIAAKTGMQQLGEAGRQAAKGSKDMEQAMGSIVGMGSKFAIIAKGFQVIRRSIVDNIIKPLAEAYKETQNLANASATKAGKQDVQVDEIKAKQKALMDYWSLYERLQDKMANGTASAEEKEQERQARRNLERYHGVSIDAKGDVESQVVDALGVSQREVEMSLDKKIADLEKAVSRQKRAVKQFDTPLNRAVYGANAVGFENDRDALVEKQFELEAALKKARADREMAKTEDPADDLYRMIRAREGDAFRGKKAAAEEEAQRAADQAAKAEAERAKVLEKANDALDSWASDLMDDDAKKRIDAAFDRYAELLEAGVSEEAAKPILDEAIRQELTKAVEREAEAREGLVNEYLSARANLKTAIKHEQDARDALTKANADLAELKKRQAQDDRLEAIDRKRQKIQRQLAGFGFSLNGSHLGESPAERRKRQMDARTDASIRRKLERSEAGRYVSFTEAEKSRLNEYNKLKKQDKALDKESKAIRAADKQAAAAENLKSASSAIKSAAESLAVATGAREAAATEANQKRWNAENAAKKEQEARDRAATGVAGRSQKYSSRLSAPARNGIAGKAVKTKDYTGALDRIAQSLGKKIYVVK